MSWIAYLLYASLFFFIILRMQFFRPAGLRKWMPPAFFAVKIIASFAIWYIYTYHYSDRSGADIWKYYDDSKVISSSFSQSPSDYFHLLTGIGGDKPRLEKEYYHRMNSWYRSFENNTPNEAKTVIRINAFFRIFSFGNFHIHSLFICFLSFIGLMALFRTLSPFAEQWKTAIAFLIFLLPSTVFWTSGMLKEGPMFFALGLLLHQSVQWLKDNRGIRLFRIIFLAWLLFITKFYLLAMLLPSLTALTWTWRYPSRPLMKFAAVIASCILITVIVRNAFPSADPLKLIAQKQNEFVRMGNGGIYLASDTAVVFLDETRHDDLVKVNDTLYHIRDGADYRYWYFYPDFSDTMYAKNAHDEADYILIMDQKRSGSMTDARPLRADWSSLLSNTPAAMTNVLLRPFVWDAKNLLFLAPALENLIFLLLLAMTLIAFNKNRISPMSLFCITFGLSMLWITGITTPIIGALVRYRIAGLPFLFAGMLMLTDTGKLKKIIKRK